MWLILALRYITWLTPTKDLRRAITQSIIRYFDRPTAKVFERYLLSFVFMEHLVEVSEDRIISNPLNIRLFSIKASDITCIGTPG